MLSIFAVFQKENAHGLIVAQIPALHEKAHEFFFSVVSFGLYLEYNFRFYVQSNNGDSKNTGFTGYCLGTYVGNTSSLGLGYKKVSFVFAVKSVLHS